MARTEEKKRKKAKKTHDPSPEQAIMKKTDKKRPRHEAPPVAAPQPAADPATGEKKKKKDKAERKRKEWRQDEGASAEVDPRFAAAQFDPRFHQMPKRKSKVTVDSRFRQILSDPNFAADAVAPVDKRGRRKEKRENPLLRYYLQEDQREDDKGSLKMKEGADGGSELEISAKELMVGEDETASDRSSSSDYEDGEDIEEDEYSVNSEVAHYLMANHEDTPMTDNETHRLAVVNLDWDHIKAVDLYVIMASCLPKGGQVLSVAIYPSEFGLKSMEIEAARGPSALIEEESNSEDDSDVENEKMRRYELNKLKYYHAVAVCDSSATANHLYKTLDGTEFLKTSNVFDLRFIPDSMEFKHPPRDIATEPPTSYKHPDFETRALQHSKVKLTWEEDEPERKKILRRKFNPDQLDELSAYLASTSESDDNDEDEENNSSENDDSSALRNIETKKHKKAEKFRALLELGNDSDADKSDDKDMEITFNTELEDLSKRILEKKDKKSETVWEAVLRKRKEKKKARKNKSKYSDEDDGSDYDGQEANDQLEGFFDEEASDTEAKVDKKRRKELCKKRKTSGKEKVDSTYLKKEQETSRAELELLVADEQGIDKGPKGYNLKPKKIKSKKGKDESVEDKLPSVNFSDDPRFAALNKNPLFALDPTDPQYKRSAAFMRQNMQKKGAGQGKVYREAFSPPEEEKDTFDKH